MKKMYSLISILVLFIIACSDDELTNSNGLDINDNETQWIVDDNTITGSLNPFDLSLNPDFVAAKDVENINLDDLVAIVYINNEVRVYPYRFISKFETINDQSGDTQFAVTYCPQTKSTLCFNRLFKKELLTLKASGYLHYDNLVAIDETTNTFWSQMKATSIKGKYAESQLETMHTIETTWKTVLNYFPEAKVFAESNVNKSTNPKSKQVDFNQGDLVYGIIQFNFNASDHNVYTYSYKHFKENNTLYKLSVSGQQIITIGNTSIGYITSFINDTPTVSYMPVIDRFPVVLKDSNNNYWNVFGVCVEGPRVNDRLSSPINYFALWWAWEDFYVNIEIQ